MKGHAKMLGVLLMTLALVAAGCGGDDGAADGATADGPTADGGATCEPSGVSVTVSAEGISFDESCLAAPAGQSFTIEFTNNDAGIQHNVAIYTDESATESLFIGDIFQGVDTMTYEVQALDAGTYFFRCDVHPGQMTGTFVAK